MVDLNSTFGYVNTAFAKANPLINRITYALLILLIGFIIGRITGKIIKKGLHAVEIDKNIGKKVYMGISLENIFSVGASVIIYFLSIIFSLKLIGLTNFWFYIIIWIIVILFLIFFLLSFKGLIKNWWGRWAVKNNYHVSVGKRIKIQNVEGKIVKTGIFETHMKTMKGEDIFIPNALFWKEKVRRIRKVIKPYKKEKDKDNNKKL